MAIGTPVGGPRPQARPIDPSAGFKRPQDVFQGGPYGGGGQGGYPDAGYGGYDAQAAVDELARNCLVAGVVSWCCCIAWPVSLYYFVKAHTEATNNGIPLPVTAKIGLALPILNIVFFTIVNLLPRL